MRDNDTMKKNSLDAQLLVPDVVRIDQYEITATAVSDDMKRYPRCGARYISIVFMGHLNNRIWRADSPLIGLN